jgi:hypothetical protein
MQLITIGNGVGRKSGGRKSRRAEVFVPPRFLYPPEVFALSLQDLSQYVQSLGTARGDDDLIDLGIDPASMKSIN